MRRMSTDCMEMLGLTAEQVEALDSDQIRQIAANIDRPIIEIDTPNENDGIDAYFVRGANVQ